MNMSGKQLKADGMERVLASTSDEWHARCQGYYRAYMDRHPHGFTGEDCKLDARERGLGEPHHPNVWGAVFSGIARSKDIVKTGEYVKSTEPLRHANEVPVWRKRDL
jgi:hypothetical protein